VDAIVGKVAKQMEARIREGMPIRDKVCNSILDLSCSTVDNDDDDDDNDDEIDMF